MKKNFVYAMMSAIALSGAVSFSACSSNEEVADVNPTYDGESVKTQFTISVGDAMSPTRMATTAVQGETSPVFEGMDDIYLFPFIGDVNKDALISESYIHLAKFDGFDDPVETAQGKIYKDVNLSVGVNNFLFYGAIYSTKKGYGELKPSYLDMTDPDPAKWKQSTWNPSPIVKGTTKVGDLTFDLVPINKGKTLTDVKEDASAIATIKPLNKADSALTAAIAAITGSSLAETTARDQLVEIQKTLRNELTSGTYTPYAGSSKSIKSLMEMLYSTLKNLAGSTLKSGEGTSYGDGVIAALTTDDDASFTASGNDTEGYTLAWKSNLNFPEDSFGVPDGAAAVQFVTGTGTGTGKFEYFQTSVEGLAVPSIDRYTYPARLYYTVNSPSMVRSTVYLKDANNANATWEAVTDNYLDGAVAANTRSVIMKKQVQYAVGRLDVNVKVKPETIINDNSKSDGGQPVSVPTEGYKLTGVLIGGQKQVGWDFTPIGADEMTIWDNDMTSTITAKQGADFAGPNHTLALETKTNTAINIALEFVNTGNDFCGVGHNVIPAGTKFYLVAQLDPSSNTTYKEQDPETPWAPGSAFINQVIKQDYVTTVNLTIGANSLKSAYNVVPDLRSPKLEFGLSVDLHWRKGITFDVEF